MSITRPFNGVSHFTRIAALGVFVTLMFGGILTRLFQLQVVRTSLYADIAKSQHFGAITLPARRGEILVRDTHSGELSKLATNTTLDLLYVDPLVAEDKVGIAKILAPLLFTRDEYQQCLVKPAECQYSVLQDEYGEDFSTTEPVWKLGQSAASASAANDERHFKDYDYLVDEVAAQILRKISKLEVDFVILRRDAEPDLVAQALNAGIPGLFTDPKRFLIYADPTLIPENQFAEAAEKTAELLGQPVADLKKALTRRKVRYVFLKNKLDPDVSRKIRSLNLRGVVLLPEHWRYYPEGGLASNLVGFLSREGQGQYGIEGYFNTDLEGKKGRIYAESDPFGRQITVGQSEIVNAVDGDTVVLTIDRIVQKKVEEILSEAVKEFKADSGQVVILNPFTGAIVAMANAPSFDPNQFGEAFTLRTLGVHEEIPKTVPVFRRDEKSRYVPATEEDLKNPLIEKFVYENLFGPGVFKNKAVSEYYEPGSVFKPLIMSIALDSREVDPQTWYMDDGPLHIDEFEIKNSLNRYYGKTTMTQVLEKSLNTGMAFVAKKLGKQLMYKYLTDFGFGQYTDIRLEGEVKGRLDHFKQWSKAQLLTTAFGQGIVVTPLQMAAAWSAMANGGKLMQPYIVDTVLKNGQPVKTDPQVLNRVMSEETSSVITSMLVNVVKNGLGHRADMPGYLVAGKTGTSQIAGPNGKYETGDGAYITSFAGYFPALKPQFVMLVKFDRPRIGDNTWGENTAAPTFRRVAEFLVDYYNIPPETSG